MFGRSFQVARIAGIGIEIHPSWLLILGLVSWSLSAEAFPDLYEGWSEATYWIVGTLAAFLLFAAVLLHELAHAFVAIRRGLPVPKITLFIFGGVSHMGRQPATAGEEFFIAAAGPATSILIGLVSAVVALVFAGVNEQVEGVASYLALVNLLLAVFNLLPGFPLDGGRVLRSIIWKRTGSFRTATRSASNVGVIFGYGLMAAGLAFVLAGYALNGIWFAFIGWFLAGAARGEAETLQLESILGPLKARDIMTADFRSVTPGTPIQVIVDDHLVGEGHRAVMIANDGIVQGILTVSDIRHIDRRAWPNTPAQQAMTPRERILTVEATSPAMDVLQAIAQHSLNQVPVLEEGRMIGLITRRELIDRIQVAEQLSRNGEA